MVGELCTNAAILGGFFLLLAVGGLVADHILPYIPAVNKFIANLPAMREDET